MTGVNAATPVICDDGAVMSHSQPVTSPPGTPLEDRTVGEIVATHPGLSRVFQSRGLDFCCQGSKTLRQACNAKGLPLGEVVAELEAARAGTPAPGSNPAELPMPELIDHIVDTHHGFLRRELPRLHAMAARVAEVHGGHTPSLVELYQVFFGMAEELVNHMGKEEGILFPAIKRMVSSGSPTLPLDGPIACMITEHEDAGGALARLRELTHGYQPPAEACNTYRALFAGLADFEEDMHRHIHLENQVLFPAALKAQAS